MELIPLYSYDGVIISNNYWLPNTKLVSTSWFEIDVRLEHEMFLQIYTQSLLPASNIDQTQFNSSY